MALAGSLFIPTSFAAPNDLTLTLLSSSEADVAGNPNNVFIGEVMTYQLVYEVPEGTSTNVAITANLPAGLQYVTATATSVVANNNGWTAPMSVTGGGSSGAAVSFNFGTIINTDVDANAETITIQFKVIVNNVVGNQSGTTLSVNGQLRINSVLTTTSGSVIVTIIEPNLSIVSYTIASPAGLIATSYPATAAGDTYNYRISFTNSGTAPAYDVVLSIILPLSYVFETTGVYTVSGAPTCGTASLSGISPVIVTFPCLNPGATLSVQVNVTVSGTVQPLDSWLSSASLTNYASLPDENGSNNDVPGAYGTATGARTGTDGSGGVLNNYATTVTNSPSVFVPEIFITFDSATSTAAEAGSIGNLLRITTASGSATSTAVTVAISVTGGTAAAGDYTLGGTITIPSGTANNTLFPVGSGFSVNNDIIVEPDETVNLQLSAPSANAVLGAQTTHTHTIQNDDTTTLTIGDNTIVEGNTGTSTLNFTVTNSEVVQGGFTVAYSLTDGTATIANNDYAAAGSSLTFTGTAGETRTIPVTINGDLNIEANETFTAAFGAISGTTIGQASFVRPDTGTGTINNDDAAGIAVTPTTIAIAEGGATATFGVAAQANPVSPVSIPVTTDGECAVSVNPVVLAAGNVTPVTVTVTSVDDLDVEGTHTCVITLGDPTSADANYHNLNAVDVADVIA
ncbi:MAG: DUF11 domain-containing protein, partial [Anaerolineae bacterium]|nr:DUF11 domain-containing protein [Anaerolineae bacterium]